MKNLSSQVAEISVKYKPAISDKPIVISALDAYKILIDFFPINTIYLQEHFLVMYLNNAGRVLGIYRLSTGGITKTVVDIKLLLSVGLKSMASSIIVCHNHPSGSLKPSNSDIEVTKKIKLAADLVEIALLDHLIISPVTKDYFSLANEGLM